ncbi:hypothetical protein GCM10022294_23030 [Dietzia aurantiaca]
MGGGDGHGGGGQRKSGGEGTGAGFVHVRPIGRVDRGITESAAFHGLAAHCREGQPGRGWPGLAGLDGPVGANNPHPFLIGRVLAGIGRVDPCRIATGSHEMRPDFTNRDRPGKGRDVGGAAP